MNNKVLNLTLTEFSEDDLTQEYISWLNDPEVVKYSELRHSTHNENTCFNYLKSMLDANNPYWAIKVENTHIGNISAYLDKNNQRANLAILIGNKHYWGKGLGLLAWQQAINLLFTNHNIQKITAGTMSINHSMLSIFKKTMQIEAEIKNYFIYNGQFINLIQAGLSKPY